MNCIDVTSVPMNYFSAVDEKHRGSVSEASYPVWNYINPSRQLVTNQQIPREEAGRETVSGNPIQKKCLVYLPAGYDEAEDVRYNVLYLLHGVGGNRFEWLQDSSSGNGHNALCSLVDHLIAAGQIEPLIIVFPEGRSAWDWEDCAFNPLGTNLLGFYYLDYELRHDLIPFIEAAYKTHADIRNTTVEGISYNRMHRAVAGLSMGGMQALNLILGGYRCDAEIYTQSKGGWSNGLAETVKAPGMEDLFSHIGAFSNAPTSSGGRVLGSSIAARGYDLHLLYLTCGDADGISIQNGYAKAVDGLLEAAGGCIRNSYQVVIEDGVHDFNVWHNGAYNFLRLSFKHWEQTAQPVAVRMKLDAR